MTKDPQKVTRRTFLKYMTVGLATLGIPALSGCEDGPIEPEPTTPPFTEEFYMKLNPPPDVDKATHNHVGTGTCWQATAANMLAGAGYGKGEIILRS